MQADLLRDNLILHDASLVTKLRLRPSLLLRVCQIQSLSPQSTLTEVTAKPPSKINWLSTTSTQMIQ